LNAGCNTDGFATTNIEIPLWKSSNPLPKLKKSSTPSNRTDGTPPIPDDTNVGRAEPEPDATIGVEVVLVHVDTVAPSPPGTVEASNANTNPLLGIPAGGAGGACGVAGTEAEAADSPPALYAVTT
jgi:hypothetical protein